MPNLATLPLAADTVIVNHHPPCSTNPNRLPACSYLLAHIYSGPGDNRKSLGEVARALGVADAAYMEEARKGNGPVAAAGR